MHRHAAPYILGCLTGFLLSAFVFNLLAGPFSPHTPLTARFSSPSQPIHPMAPRQFSHGHDADDAWQDGAIPEDLELNGAAIHANHSTFKLLACLEQLAPPESAIVPTRSHPSFAITVLFPKHQHGTSDALMEHGVDDVHILHVAAPLFHGECGNGVARPPGLVVVQQADVGFLALYAASVGCPVLVLEHRPLMLQALQSTLCANPQYRSRVLLQPLALNDGTAADDTTPVRAYVGLDSKEGAYREEDAETRMDCTQPDVATRCADVASASLTALLRNSSAVYRQLNHYPRQAERPVFLLQLSGDATSVRSLLASSALLQSSRVYHVLLPFRPHLLGVRLAKELLTQMELFGYEIAEIPYIPPESSFSLFQSVKSYLASSFASLASYTRPLKYDEMDTYAERVFECNDKRQACKVDLLFTLMSGRFLAGIVPFRAADAPALVPKGMGLGLAQ